MSSRTLTLLLVGLAACSGAPSTPPPQPGNPDTTQGPPAGAPRPGAVARTRFLRLENGVTVTVLPHRRDDVAQIQIALLAGTDFGARALAELSAEVLVGSGDATGGRASVRQRVTELGGTLSIEVYPLSTWITIRVPHARWNQAQTALGEALMAPSISRSQIERVRDEYVLKRINDVWANPNREVPRAFLLGHLGTSPYIASLLDRDPSEVSLFAARLYRPDSTMLTIQVPGNDSHIRDRLNEGIGKWPASTTARAVVEVEPRRLEPGLYWAPSDPAQVCRATIILPLPVTTEPLAAELFTMHACLTLDGIGGRLEGLQRERGLGGIAWTTEVLHLADVPAIALTASTTPANAIALWDTVREARQSLADLPPTDSELQLAVRRARLTVQLLSARAETRSRTRTMLATLRRADDALDKRIALLARPGAFNARVAALGYLKMPAAMVVVGGHPPDDAPEHTEFELLPPGAYARLVSSDPVVQAAAATPWLDRAIEAFGGADILRRVRGFAFESTLRGEGAPPATERLQWDRRGNTIARTRDVLGTVIETTITANGAIERCGDTEVKLSPAAVSYLRREIARHPVSLLAACARGDLRFRPVAQRTVGDRDLMILEAVGDDFDRLRIHLDTVSHLIRVVEVWETTSDGAVVHVHDAWSDYRNKAAIRVPFRRITEHDDGRNRIEATYSDWRPLLRTR